jgi:hypothetical protein
MVIWFKVLLVLLIVYNGGFLATYITSKAPIRFWIDFFSVRNVLGWIYGIVLFLLSIPATILFYVFFWILVLVTWMDIFGTKKSYRMAKFAQRIDEEDEK